MKLDAIETIRQSDYKLIIFDCDGTLVDSESISNRVVATMIRELGYQISDQEALERFKGKSFSDINTFISEQLPLVEIDFEAAFRPRVNHEFHRELKPIKGVVKFIEKINIPICIASNAPQKKMAVTLPICGLSRFFTQDQIFSAYDIQEWKPDPRLFLHAAKNMGVASSDCLVIEDSTSGAQAALNANMNVIAYAGNDSEGLGIPGLPIFNSYAQLSESFFAG